MSQQEKGKVSAEWRSDEWTGSEEIKVKKERRGNTWRKKKSKMKANV